MEIKLLEGIGLSEGETKVYLALIKLGTTKTGNLALQAGVSTSKVYKILNRLEKKGLTGHIIKNNVKHYRSLDPNRLIDYIDEKEKELIKKRELVKQLIPQIITEQKNKKKPTEATIYNGVKAITNIFKNILDELKVGETYYVIGASYIPEVRPFFNLHHKRRAQKGIKLKMLANHDTKDNLEKNTYLKAEIKFLPQYLITNTEMVFYNNKLLMVLWTKEPYCFLIEDEEAVNSFRKYFYTFWKIAKN